MPIGTIESYCSPRGKWVTVARRAGGGYREFEGDDVESTEAAAEKWLHREL